jgi:hypothetical protein
VVLFDPWSKVPFCISLPRFDSQCSFLFEWSSSYFLKILFDFWLFMPFKSSIAITILDYNNNDRALKKMSQTTPAEIQII